MRRLSLPAMILGSLLLGWLVSRSLGWGWLPALAFAGMTLVAWFWLNLRSGTTGLFKANLSSYFAFRLRGLPVDQALRAMVAARYPFDFQSPARERVIDFLSGNPYRGPSQSERLYVTTTVFLVFCAEHGILRPPPEKEQKYFAEIESLYDRMAMRYGFPREA